MTQSECPVTVLKLSVWLRWPGQVPLSSIGHGLEEQNKRRSPGKVRPEFEGGDADKAWFIWTVRNTQCG